MPYNISRSISLPLGLLSGNLLKIIANNTNLILLNINLQHCKCMRLRNFTYDTEIT